MDRETPEAYVDGREMARQLGVSLSTLDRMRRAGQIPSVTWMRRTRRYLPSEVKAWLAEREAESRD